MMGSTLSKTSRAQQTSHKTNRFTTDTFGRQNCAGIYLPHKLRVDRQRQYELVFTPIFLFIAHQMTTRICHANGLGHAGRFSSATSGLKFGRILHGLRRRHNPEQMLGYLTIRLAVYPHLAFCGSARICVCEVLRRVIPKSIVR